MLSELQAERARLVQARSTMKVDVQRLEVDRELLSEDRKAFDTRVQRKASAVLEEAQARYGDLEVRLTVARKECDRLYEQLRTYEEAERRLGNRSPNEVKHELDALTHERDSLKQQLAMRPNAEAVARLQELERTREEWENERLQLKQEVMEMKHALARSSIAVTEIETLRDQKAALEWAEISSMLHSRNSDRT